jgi:cell division protein FtsW (lipid II flippase)
LGILIWVGALFFLDNQTSKWLPNRDPYLIPLAGLLSGWGLLTVWRLTIFFGFRQTLWLALCAALFILALRMKDRILSLLRQYKYLWLITGFLITALTFFFGTNPSGIGPRLWLGGYGIYFQPSEILKLLLITYLAAYLAERKPLTPGLLPLLAPTALMTGAALLLLLIQRDLGTAWVFIFIYTIVVFAAAGKRRVLLAAVFILILALIAGNQLVGLVHERVSVWLNPWADPSNTGYQIIQGLLAISSGGLLGRGPGMGAPEVVPVNHSDFIFTSIVEETGLVGAIGLIVLIAFLCLRALRISLQARDAYQRYMAIGLSAYLACQSLLIIGGNIRMLPLTGVTLPFVSYGGSSMLASFFALFLLIAISHDGLRRSAPVSNWRPTLIVAGIFVAAFSIAAMITGWWGYVRGPDLLTRSDNVRRAQSDHFVRRGALMDRNGIVFNDTSGSPGEYMREYIYPEITNVFGYSHPILGQSGLEEGLDPILRGEERQPAFTIWINHLLYGQPAPGLDVRLTLDANLQMKAVQQLDESGAVVLMDAQSGELLVMASQPSFNPDAINDDWNSITQDENSPLLNRAAQGFYAPGSAMGPFLLSATETDGLAPSPPSELSFAVDEYRYECIREPEDPQNWTDLIKAGCPGALAQLGISLGGERLLNLFIELGFYSTPLLPLEIHGEGAPTSLDRPENAAIGQDGMKVSPLQMAIASCALSNNGEIVSPQIAQAVQHSDGSLENLLADPDSVRVFSRNAVGSVTQKLKVANRSFWELNGQSLGDDGQSISWYLAGSLPGSEPSRCVVVLLESDDLAKAKAVGRQLLQAAIE